VAYTAQIAFTLFTDVADGNNRPPKANSILPGGTKSPKQGDDAGSVVGYSRQKQRPASPLERKGCGGREDRVEMSANHNGFAASTIVGRCHIADRIRNRPQFQLCKFRAEHLRALRFPKWGRRDLSDADLIRFDFSFVVGDIAKGSLDSLIREYRINTFAHYLISKTTGADSITG
jgi:hypothetical protein